MGSFGSQTQSKLLPAQVPLCVQSEQSSPLPPELLLVPPLLELLLPELLPLELLEVVPPELELLLLAQ